MAFNLGNFIEDIFKPQKGEKVTIMYDLPHVEIKDNLAWQERRNMAEEWHHNLALIADRWHISINPIVTYNATGKNNSDLPVYCFMEGKKIRTEDIIKDSTILISMPEFSATAPLYILARNLKKLRVGSMPGAAKFMEESGLSANYSEIAEKCKILVDIFNKAIGAEVEFSTGHKCFFDLSANHPALPDDGILYPDRAGTDNSLSNLPAGEVFCVPNEDEDSGTCGELPNRIGDEIAVYVVKNNRIKDVKGKGPLIKELRDVFRKDPAWQNIAEFALGLNDKARVTGNILEDEKAGFHWAYGRSDHLGGNVGVKDFNSPDNVIHMDIVYAKGSPINCKKLDMIFPDKTCQTLIIDGELQV